jgi:sugar lactone lactonase YvrE
MKRGRRLGRAATAALQLALACIVHARLATPVHAAPAPPNIYVTNSCTASVTAYRLGARNNAAPLVSNSGLGLPVALATGPDGKIYAANYCVVDLTGQTRNAITVYPAGSSGNTPPIATITGPHTALNFPTGVAVDNDSNIYVSNVLSQNITVYPAASNGDVTPTQKIRGSHTGIARPMGVAVDAAKNIYVANLLNGGIYMFSAGSNGDVPPAAGILTFNSDHWTGITRDSTGNLFLTGFTFHDGPFVEEFAAGTEGFGVSPIATIQGSATGLSFPRGVQVDGAGNIYVIDGDNPLFDQTGANAVFVYAPGSNGNVAPVRQIKGSLTRLDAPDAIALAPSGDVYVGNYYSDTVNIYPGSAQGNVSPSSVLGNSFINKMNMPSGVAVTPGGLIYVTNSGFLTCCGSNGGNSVNTYGVGSAAASAPLTRILGDNTQLDFPIGVALDSSKQIYVLNWGATSSTPSINVYAAGAHGNVTPTAIMTGGSASAPLAEVSAITVDTNGKIYVTDMKSGDPDQQPTVSIFDAVVNGPATPSAVIEGPDTGLAAPAGISVDSSGNVFVVNSAIDGGTPSVTVYAAGSSGDASPIATISGSNTRLALPLGVALEPGGTIDVVQGSPSRITKYPSGSDGDITPTATVGGVATQLATPRQIAIGR